jgi:hypothetical protein
LQYENANYHLKFTDTLGMEARQRDLLSKCVKSADIVLLVYSQQSERSLHALPYWMTMVKAFVNCQFAVCCVDLGGAVEVEKCDVESVAE